MKNKVEIINSGHKDFEMQRDGLISSMTDLEKRSISLEINKVDKEDVDKSFKDVKHIINKKGAAFDQIKNDVLALENYIERYQPLNTLKVIKKLVGPILEQDKFKKFEKQASRFTEEMQSQILTDIGSGSIFDQIIKINEEMSKKL